jgi:hypothetical protein
VACTVARDGARVLPCTPEEHDAQQLLVTKWSGELAAEEVP